MIPTKGLAAATLCLVTCAAAAAQAPGRNDWLLLPQLVRGQEFTYSGWFIEEKTDAGVQNQRTYKLESSLLVLGGAAKKWDVAFLTVLSLRDHLPGQPPGPRPAPPASVRLELAEVTAQGQVRPASGTSLLVPLEGPPTAECGAVVEVPRSAVGPQQFWEVAEDGRPPRTWRVAGTETAAGTLCVKLVGVQQSDDWDRPRGDSTAWQRRDTVWLSPQLGVACKVERVLERREPLRREPTYRATVRYERDSQVTYLGKLFEDCTREIEQARKFQAEADPLLRQPALYRPRIEALLRRIAFHLQQPPSVGQYRKAVVQLQRRLEAAKRGEAAPAPDDGVGEVISRALPGQRVPDFVVTELINHQSVRLYRMLGRPVLLIFYSPMTAMGKQVLQFGQQVSDKLRPGVTVLGLAVSDDEELVRTQHAELHLTYPILDGNGLHQTFGVDGTPRFVVLDGEGIYRGGFTGWGAQTSREVTTEVQRWLPK